MSSNLMPVTAEFVKYYLNFQLQNTRADIAQVAIAKAMFQKAQLEEQIANRNSRVLISSLGKLEGKVLQKKANRYMTFEFRDILYSALNCFYSPRFYKVGYVQGKLSEMEMDLINDEYLYLKQLLVMQDHSFLFHRPEYVDAEKLQKEITFYTQDGIINTSSAQDWFFYRIVEGYKAGAYSSQVECQLLDYLELCATQRVSRTRSVKPELYEALGGNVPGTPFYDDYAGESSPSVGGFDSAVDISSTAVTDQKVARIPIRSELMRDLYSCALHDNHTTFLSALELEGMIAAGQKNGTLTRSDVYALLPKVAALRNYVERLQGGHCSTAYSSSAIELFTMLYSVEQESEEEWRAVARKIDSDNQSGVLTAEEYQELVALIDRCSSEMENLVYTQRGRMDLVTLNSTLKTCVSLDMLREECDALVQSGECCFVWQRDLFFTRVGSAKNIGAITEEQRRDMVDAITRRVQGQRTNGGGAKVVNGISRMKLF